MDVHRCRFVSYPPAAINAVAFSHPNALGKAGKKVPARLAIGRANGDIEIWNPLNGLWHQETVIQGGRDRSIDGLVWLTGNDDEIEGGGRVLGRMRLFSIGYTATVTEWDLENATAKQHATGQHGDIWCLAAQPKPAQGASMPSVSHSQMLVAGTSDGSLVLYDTDDDELRFQRLFRAHSKKVRVVSIAFQSRNSVVVGCSDSTIRVFNVRNGSAVRQMSLGRDLMGGAKDIIVWSVRCLKNGDIVSGDSTGRICIWDGKTYTLAQRLQSHDHDVLSLAVNADGTRIFSGGMDRRIAMHQTVAGSKGRWTKAWHRRYHEHDVKAMATFETRGISVVVSGGT
jgi:U3 small nucleolar RNA-associated protein 4